LVLQSLDFDRTRWRLFRKRVVRTKCDIYVFIKFEIYKLILIILNYIKAPSFIFWILCMLWKIMSNMSQGMLTTMLFTNGSVVHVLIELMIINLLLEEHRNRSGLFRKSMSNKNWFVYVYDAICFVSLDLRFRSYQHITGTVTL
jgi:hypothetical protein